jgi:hypothetical protein
MNNSYINQITLDCLLNKEIMGNHVMKQREKQINKQEYNFYRKRIYNLFKEIISNKIPKDLPPDVKYSYDTFIKASIHYFKIIDNNDLLQEEYKDINVQIQEKNDEIDISSNNYINDEANKLMMRSVKMDIPTLDKYVKRISNIKKNEIVIPKTREVNIMVPELKNKGLKKNNISNLYGHNKEEKKEN